MQRYFCKINQIGCHSARLVTVVELFCDLKMEITIEERLTWIEEGKTIARGMDLSADETKEYVKDYVEIKKKNKCERKEIEIFKKQ